MSKFRVVRKLVSRLRRGDQIIALCHAGVKRRAGVNQRAKVVGEFIMRKPAPCGDVFVITRNAEGRVCGGVICTPLDYVAFVLVQREEVAA